jgi:hypothetical protein
MSYEKTFTFDDGFNFEHALYSQEHGFVSAYRRTREVEPSNKSHIKVAANGAVHHSIDLHYSYYSPVILMADGSLFVQRAAAEKPDHRGRYTFGKYDFSIISTGSNDLYGQIAIKYMSLNDNTKTEPYPLPKMNAATLNQGVNGVSARALLIDHVADRVYSLSSTLINSTADGCFPATDVEALPKETRDMYNWRGYFLAAGSEMFTPSAIRLTRPRTGKLLSDKYKEITSSCLAWLKLRNDAADGYKLREAWVIDNNGARAPNTGHTFTLEQIEQMDFATMHPYDRWLVAKNNATQSPPRLTHWVYSLRFDSQLFFKELETL